MASVPGCSTLTRQWSPWRGRRTARRVQSLERPTAARLSVLSRRSRRCPCLGCRATGSTGSSRALLRGTGKGAKWEKVSDVPDRGYQCGHSWPPFVKSCRGAATIYRVTKAGWWLAPLLPASSPEEVVLSSCVGLRPWRLLALLWSIPLPNPFDGVRQELRPGVADAMGGSATKQILI